MADEAGQPDERQPERGPRAGTVALLMAALVVVVLGASIVSALLPGMDGVLASLPVVVLVLVAGTLVVMVRSALR